VYGYFPSLVFIILLTGKPCPKGAADLREPVRLTGTGQRRLATSDLFFGHRVIADVDLRFQDPGAARPYAGAAPT